MILSDIVRLKASLVRGCTFSLLVRLSFFAGGDSMRLRCLFHLDWMRCGLNWRSVNHLLGCLSFFGRMDGLLRMWCHLLSCMLLLFHWCHLVVHVFRCWHNLLGILFCGLLCLCSLCLCSEFSLSSCFSFGRDLGLLCSLFCCLTSMLLLCLALSFGLHFGFLCSCQCLCSLFSTFCNQGMFRFDA